MTIVLFRNGKNVFMLALFMNVNGVVLLVLLTTGNDAMILVLFGNHKTQRTCRDRWEGENLR